MPVVIKKPSVMAAEFDIEALVKKSLQGIRENYHYEHVRKVSVRSPAMKWRLSSAMQKAFRRCDEDRLLLMISGLLLIDPNYVWRRFCIVVMEDGGPSIPHYRDHFAAMMYFAQGKANRQKYGVTDDDLIRYAHLANYYPKCRAVSDAVTVSMRRDVAGIAAKMKTCEIYEFGPTILFPNPHTSMGLTTLAGEHKYAPGKATATVLDSPSINPLDRWIAVTGASIKMGGMFSVYPWVIANYHHVTVGDDEMPPEIMIGNYPGYIFDMHVSDGQRALRYFLAMKDNPYVKMTEEICKGDKQQMYDVTKEPLFWAEIARLKRRLLMTDELNSLGEILQGQALYACSEDRGIPTEMVVSHAEALFNNIEALNYARQKVIQP